jgi:hypothetical protein
MSKAKKIIVSVYQRTWNRDTACSAGSFPDKNGNRSAAGGAIRTSHASE